jgi:hypothetical protein
MGSIAAEAMFVGAAATGRMGSDTVKSLQAGGRSLSNAKNYLRQTPTGATWAPGLAKALEGRPHRPRTPWLAPSAGVRRVCLTTC